MYLYVHDETQDNCLFPKIISVGRGPNTTVIIYIYNKSTLSPAASDEITRFSFFFVYRRFRVYSAVAKNVGQVIGSAAAHSRTLGVARSKTTATIRRRPSLNRASVTGRFPFEEKTISIPVRFARPKWKPTRKTDRGVFLIVFGRRTTHARTRP